MKWIKGVIVGAFLLVITGAGLGLFYVLPQYDVVAITGVEVKRVDDDGVINAENPADGRPGTCISLTLNTQHRKW